MQSSDRGTRTFMRPVLCAVVIFLLQAGLVFQAAADVLEDLMLERYLLEQKLQDHTPDPAKIELGQKLFFDKILSGNENISCATCHHPFAWTGDGLSLPVGEGGSGLGVTRDAGVYRGRGHAQGAGQEGIRARVPRNALPVWNLRLAMLDEWPVMFWDGRLREDPYHPSGFFSPAGLQLPPGLENVVAAQAMFPVQSADEMAGQIRENRVANLASQGELSRLGGLWDILARRLRDIPGYVELFRNAYADIQEPRDISFVHAANAIALFEAEMGHSLDSPFDRFLLGDDTAMTPQALAGMDLFYGPAGCSSCHQGVVQTDLDFHCIGVPHLGPGKGNGPIGRDDFGRENVTGDPRDRYRFRTPSLRMVALNGPWGHSGAFNSLEAMVRHHLDPVESLAGYDPGQAVLPSRPDLDAEDFLLLDDPEWKSGLIGYIELTPAWLTDAEVGDLLAFLHSLTDHTVLDMRKFVPASVPSGLAVAD